jgi:SHOCT-like protein
MSEERARILQMVSEGKISAEEGVKLLNALRSTKSTTSERQSEASPRWIRVRVTDVVTGRTRVNVNLPFSLVTAATKLGARFSPQTEDLDWEELIAAIKEGASGKIVDVEDNESGEKVEVFVE